MLVQNYTTHFYMYVQYHNMVYAEWKSFKESVTPDYVDRPDGNLIGKVLMRTPGARCLITINEPVD